MGNISYGRVILGGIVAGIVADILDYFVDGVWLSQLWSDGMKMLNHPAAISVRQIVLLNLLGIACGILAVWIYAAIRPRFGAGVKTAVYAGLVTWALTALLPNASFIYVAHLFGGRVTLFTTLGALVEIVVGTIAGAALYKEAVAAPRPVASEAPRQAISA